MRSKEELDMIKTIERIRKEGKKYRITNKKLYYLCKDIEDIILEATPENFEMNLDIPDFEIVRFCDWDGGIWKDFRYLRYKGRVLTSYYFNQYWTVETGYREQRLEFLHNLDKILKAIIEKLEKSNISAEQLLAKIKIVE